MSARVDVVGDAQQTARALVNVALAEGSTPMLTSACSKLWSNSWGGLSIWWLPRPSRTHISGSRSSRRRLCSMRLEAKKYLYDMQQAAALLTQFTAGKQFAD